MTIVSKRGRPAPQVAKDLPVPSPVSGGFGVIHIYDLSGKGFPLSEEEQKQIHEIFENIRKQLDGLMTIGDLHEDWMI